MLQICSEAFKLHATRSWYTDVHLIKYLLQIKFNGFDLKRNGQASLKETAVWTQFAKKRGRKQWKGRGATQRQQQEMIHKHEWSSKQQLHTNGADPKFLSSAWPGPGLVAANPAGHRPLVQQASSLPAQKIPCCVWCKVCKSLASSLWHPQSVKISNYSTHVIAITRYMRRFSHSLRMLPSRSHTRKQVSASWMEEQHWNAQSLGGGGDIMCICEKEPHKYVYFMFQYGAVSWR